MENACFASAYARVDNRCRGRQIQRAADRLYRPYDAVGPARRCFYAHRLGNAAAIWTYDVHRTDACMAARYAVRQAPRCSEHRRASTAADLRCGYLAILCGHRNGRGKLSAAGQYIVSARGTCCRPYLSDKYRTVSYVGHCRAGSRTYRNSRDRAKTASDRRHSRAPREMARTSLQLVLGQHSIGAFAVCFRRRQRKFRRIAYGGVFSA